MKLYNIRTKEIDIISILLSFTFYANLVQIKPVSRLSLLENVLCNPCSLACFLSYFHFYIYMMQSHSWMSYLTKEYTEKEALYLENVNRTGLFTLMASPFYVGLIHFLLDSKSRVKNSNAFWATSHVLSCPLKEELLLLKPLQRH